MRKTPYTQIGIERLKCFRCKKRKANQQWGICADNNIWRPICILCDIDLNEMALKFMKFKDWKSKLNEYKKRFE